MAANKLNNTQKIPQISTQRAHFKDFSIKNLLFTYILRRRILLEIMRNTLWIIMGYPQVTSKPIFQNFIFLFLYESTF